MLRRVLFGFWLLALSGCTQLMFLPTSQHILTPDKINLAYQDHYFPSSDGTQLHGWWLPAQGKPHATVIYMHGNAQNISNHLGNAYWLPANGVNLFIFDYRGYGHSSGQASLPGAIADIDAALQQALQLSDDTPLIVMAHSLGAAMAIHSLAHSTTKPHIKGAILASAFSDYQQVAREVMAQAWLLWPFQYPLSWSFDNRYSPLNSVAMLAPIPQLYLHSPQDTIIDIRHSEALFAKARPPKHLERVKGGHNQIFLPQENRRLVLEAISRWSQSPQALQ